MGKSQTSVGNEAAFYICSLQFAPFMLSRSIAIGGVERVSAKRIDHGTTDRQPKRKEIRRDTDSGQFVASDQPLDNMDRLFAQLERDVLGDFT
jgi:hypothetical protein